MASGDRRNGDLGNDLSSIAAALGDLAERIERGDRGTAGRRPERPANSLDRIAAMVDDLGRELDDADRNLAVRAAPTQRPAPRRPETPGRRLGELNLALQELERHVSSLSQSAASAPSQAEHLNRLDEIRSRLDALRDPRAVRDPAPADMVALPPQRLAEPEPPIRSLSAAAPSRPRDLDAAIAEIAARQQELGREIDKGNAIPRMPARVQPAVNAEQLNQIGARLEDLSRKLEATARAVARPNRLAEDDLKVLSDRMAALSALRPNRLADEDLKLLTDRMAALAAPRPEENRRLEQLRANLEEMRQAIDESARESTLRSIEAGYGHIVERLDDMVRRIPDRASIDEMATEIAELRSSMRDPEAEHFVERLERRFDLLIGEYRKASAATPDFREWFDHIEARLGEINRVIATSTAEQAHAGLGAVERLEQQLTSLTQRIDSIASAQEHPIRSIDSLAAEIAEFRNDVAAQGRYDIERLESQIRDLTDRLAGMRATEDDQAALRQLEAEVRLLVAKLETTHQRPAALDRIEEGLSQLQSVVADSRRDSIAAARDAAREAVGEYTARSGSAGDNDTYRRLRSEIGVLQAAAIDSDHRTQEALEAVHDTLRRVVDRISGLEDGQPLASEDEPVELRPTGTGDAIASAADPTTARSGRWWSSTSLAAPEDHRPLEPGSGKPQIAAGSISIADARNATASDRKADFIAAARRAAQAAAAETSSTDSPLSTGSGSGPLSRISRVLRSRKRVLVLVAAALILTAVLYPMREAALRIAGELADATLSAAMDSAASPAEAVAAEPVASTQADPLGNVLAEAGRLLPDDLRNQAAASNSDLAFAPPSGLQSEFAPDPVLPDTNGFTAALAPDPAETDPRMTASIESDASDSLVDSVDAGTPVLSIEAPAATEAPDTTPAPVAATASASVSPAATAPASAALPLPQVGPDALRQAAAAGDPVAQFEVASRYSDGRGGAQDLAEAARWFERAATRGLAPAQYRLGSLYERGVGVSRDRNLAQLWYSKAAEQGNARAMHNLAVLLSEGVDGNVDYRQAMQWFTKAANYDVRDSQYNLGVIFARGLGTAQDLEQSYKWFAIAALGGDADAASRRDEVAGVLGAKLGPAKAGVEAWKPVPLVVAANEIPALAPAWQETPARATAPAPAQTQAAAESDELIRQAQALLIQKGFDPGPADGVDGPRTRDAVREFQKLSGLEANGVIDGRLITALSGTSS